MNMTAKLWPLENGNCAVEVCITLDQLQQGAKNFIAHLIATGISPEGLYVDEFVPVVLRRQMYSLAIGSNQIGCKLKKMKILLAYDYSGIKRSHFDGEKPCILFFFATVTDAAAFRLTVV
jgi:hypothetical protein